MKNERVERRSGQTPAIEAFKRDRPPSPENPGSAIRFWVRSAGMSEEERQFKRLAV